MNVIDRVESAKHTLTGSGIGKAVSKATSHEIIGPKRKHVDYITHSLEATNISIPEVADSLFERCNNSSWVVVFKSLVTAHHLMANANERFIQYVASRQTPWMLQTFLDKGGIQGYDMSHAVRRYSTYLAEKAYSYRQMGYDFCRAARGRDKGVLRNMDTTKLLKALPVIQQQIDSLISTEINSNDLTNGVITAAFMLLFKDLIRIFACYNDGIINLLEKYFEMKKLDCRNALEIYKKFLSRMERVSEFLKTAEDAGIDKGDIPDLTKAPGSLLEALEQHLTSLEKGKSAAPPTKPLTLPAFSGDSSISAFSQPASATFQQPPPVQASNKEESDYLTEQRKILEAFEKKKQSQDVVVQQNNVVPNPLNPPASKQHQQSVKSPFAPSQPFAAPSQPAQQPTQQPTLNGSASTNNKPSDDLLMLGGSSNAFSVQNTMPSSNFASAFNSTPSYGQPQQNMFAQQQQSVDFNNAFNNTSTSATVNSSSTPNLIDDLLQPERPSSSSAAMTTMDSNVRMTGDLDTGLQRMAQSLDGLNINPNTMKANTSKGHQWNQRGETKLTGGNNYQIRNVTPSTLPPMNTMGGMGGAPMGGMQPQGIIGMNSMGMMGQQQQFQMQPQQQFYGMNQRPAFGGGMMQPQQGGMYNANMGMSASATGGFNGMQMRPQQQPMMMGGGMNSNNPMMMNNDPFK
eukprot:TCONS_00071377-protein